MRKAQRELPSPVLPLFPKEHSFAAFVAYSAEACSARPASSICAAPFFAAFSVAELPKAPLIFREKELFDCLGPVNASISLALAFLPAVGAELIRSNILPASSLMPPPEGEEEPPPPEPEPFDWLLMLQNAGLALARDILSKIVQQLVEIRAKVRVPRWLHQELVKHVPSFAEAMRGGKRSTLRATLLGRWAAAKAVGQSKFPYANRTLGLFVADALIVDTARLLFPADARTRLVLHSAAPGEASFATNLKLKVGKHVLCGCLSYAIGVVTPLVLPAAVPYFVGFMIGDIVAVLVAEGVVAKFGEIK